MKLILIGSGIALFFVCVIFLSFLRSGEAFLLEEIAACPAAAKQLGQPIERRWGGANWALGSFGSSRRAWGRMAVWGPLENGSIKYEVRKIAGGWSLVTGKVFVHGETVDLKECLVHAAVPTAVPATPQANAEKDDDAAADSAEPRVGVQKTISIVTDPPGLEVYIDGQFFGRTPSVLGGVLDSGDNQLELRKKGKIVHQETLSWDGKNEISRRIILPALPAEKAGKR